MKNKLYGIMLAIIGILSVPITKDLTFLFFATPVGIALATCKENLFEEE